ncbi:Uncharacterised protein [Mycobacteroides abscessus subsp. abscessus]|nr:Uncharacterised protein [Mycobacteroides abscessus subsp. abscessus]
MQSHERSVARTPVRLSHRGHDVLGEVPGVVASGVFGGEPVHLLVGRLTRLGRRTPQSLKPRVGQLGPVRNGRYHPAEHFIAAALVVHLVPRAGAVVARRHNHEPKVALNQLNMAIAAVVGFEC